MMFTAEELEKLGVTPDQGLNDGLREDMREGGPFLAIDPVGPAEIDDAIRVVKRSNGGYVVQTAIAEAAQLIGAESIIEGAIRKRFSTYSADGQPRRQILPRAVIKGLQLSEGERRALVVSQDYTPGLRAYSEVRLTPALIAVENDNYGRFSMKRLKAERERRPHSLLVGFNHAYRQHHELPALTATEVDAGPQPLTRYGERLVETYMVLANVAVARWADQAGVPVLYRTFDRDKTVWDKLNEERKLGGAYSVDPDVHDGIGHIIPEADAGYTHTTSPLRRAVDLINHLQIGAHLAGRELPFDDDRLQGLGSYFTQAMFRRRAPRPVVDQI